MTTQTAPFQANLMTREELAGQLRTTIRNLDRWRRLRTGPAWVAIGRRIYYRPEAVRRWLEQQERGGIAA